jgi:Mlc titration factor MtfA (ptsG expression regulator)
VFSAEFDAIRRGEIGELRDYAATDAGEFFAVACETFFTRSMALAARHPAVYDLLRRYFDQDPAGWSVPG